MRIKSLGNDRGFTLVELLVATVTMTVVLGAAVALTSQVQNGYRRQLEDSAAEQEGRYALDWITRHLRGAANDPYGKANVPGTTNCPAANTDIEGIQFDPDNDNLDDDIRLMMDANPPDGLFGGPGLVVGDCTQANEDITISHDPAADTITFLDNNTGAVVATRTDTVIEDLTFVFLDSARAVIDTDPVAANPAQVMWVEARIRIRTRTVDASTGLPMTRLMSSEVRVRSR
jgi:type II secretory pathway pseudopilin PulG